jgi:flagellar hook-associated protein 2
MIMNALRNKTKTFTQYQVDKLLTAAEEDFAKQWEDKVEEMEDRYYKKFAKMESALSNLNSQQSSISGFFQ